MDCKTARLLMHFARPRADELGPDEGDDLGAHLASCPDCAGLAQAERCLDHAFARAMRAVEPPEGLRGRLLAKLAADRADWYRRWLGHGVRVAAAAAALVLVVWGWAQYRKQTRPPLDVARVLQHFIHAPTEPQRLNDQQEVQEHFAALGAPIEAPDYKYAYLTHFGMAPLPGYPGKVVPRLEFSHRHRRAVVYVVSARQFELKKMAQLDLGPEESYGYKVTIERSDNGQFAYIVLHKGDDVEWLHKQPKGVVVGPGGGATAG